MSKPISITDQEFEQAVLRSEELVMVDFWAPWCAPCRVISPILEQLADEYAGRVKIVKVNTDESAEHAAQYRVQGMPTLILFRNGAEVDRIIGAGTKAYYKHRLDTVLNGA